MFRTKKLKSKSPTDSRDFCPDPPSNKKLKSLRFWMNKTILIIFAIFLKKTNFGKIYENTIDPPAPAVLYSSWDLWDPDSLSKKNAILSDFYNSPVLAYFGAKFH